ARADDVDADVLAFEIGAPGARERAHRRFAGAVDAQDRQAGEPVMEAFRMIEPPSRKSVPFPGRTHSSRRRSCPPTGAGSRSEPVSPDHSVGAAPERASMRRWASAAGGPPELARDGALDGAKRVQ